MAPVLRILEPGLLTTIQDLGRVGYQHLGVTTSGALDPVSLRAANALVGNTAGSGALEVAYVGPTFVVEADSARLACVGSASSVEVLPNERAVGGVRISPMQSFRVQRGDVVRIGATSGSSVLYIAVEGGLSVDPVLGSVSTFVRGGIGGWQGRPLVAGDALPLRLDAASDRIEFRLEGMSLARPPRFRAIPGPQSNFFSERSIGEFFDHEYVVKPATDRMAMHLAGKKLDHLAGHDIVSDGIAPGSIQVPGHGQPIILMADRQTTGGYPKIATVISADLAALGRVRIGETISFERITIEEAQYLRCKFLEEIEAIPSRLVPLARDPGALMTQLMLSNLISGAINAHSPQISE